MQDWKQWRHLFKLDPAKPLEEKALGALAASGTDGFVIGGTDGVTLANTVSLFQRVSMYNLPCVQEISHVESIVPGLELYLLPLVLNAGSTVWLRDAHLQGLQRYGPLIPWERVVVEGYLVGNPHSAVARKAKCRTELTAAEVGSYALFAERVLHLPLFYVEFSGIYGGTAWLQEVRQQLESAHLVYGGGLNSPERVVEASRWADTVVVGNAIYEDLQGALRTVAAAKQ